MAEADFGDDVLVECVSTVIASCLSPLTSGSDTEWLAHAVPRNILVGGTHRTGKSELLSRIHDVLSDHVPVCGSFIASICCTPQSNHNEDLHYRWIMCAKHADASPSYEEAVKAHHVYARMEATAVEWKASERTGVFLIDDIDMLTTSNITGIPQDKALLTCLNAWNCSDCGVFVGKKAENDTFEAEMYVVGFSPNLSLVASHTESTLLSPIFAPVAAIEPTPLPWGHGCGDTCKDRVSNFPKVLNDTEIKSVLPFFVSRSATLEGAISKDATAHWKAQHVYDLAPLPPAPMTDFAAVSDDFSLSWPSFFGYSELKAQLETRVLTPFLATLEPSLPSFAAAAARIKRMNVKPPCGVLIHGNSGSGKTALAKSIAATSCLNYMFVQCSELLSKYVGDSEASLRSVFQAARKASPCVIVLDNIDAIATNRAKDSAGSSHVQERVLSTLLNELDGVGHIASQTHGRTTNAVLIVATCTSLDDLDAALLRAGRLEVHVCVPPPTASDTYALLQGCLPCNLTEDSALVHSFTRLTAAQVVKIATVARAMLDGKVSADLTADDATTCLTEASKSMGLHTT